MKKQHASSAAASATFINVLAVIDTDYVRNNYTNPSTDPAHPTAIDHNSQFMICTGSRGIISGQGTADLNFKANPGDVVSFYGESIYANSDDAVILYAIDFWQGTNVFNPFSLNTVTRTGAVFPNTQSPTFNGLPAVQAPASFNALGSTVARAGTEGFYVQFGLYVLDPTGENQVLYGYFSWDPTITVQ